MKAVERMLGRNGAVRPRLNLCVRNRGDQLNHKSVGIKQSNYFFSETRRGFFSRDVLLFQTLQPIPN